MKRLVLLVAIIAWISTSAGVFAQTEPVKLPKPKGHFPVGTATYYWDDGTRNFNYSSFGGDLRTIIVQIWFPSEEDPEAVDAPYSAMSTDYRHVESYSKLMTGFSKTAASCPLVVISPGRGVERFGYTTLAESLASKGYVVAAVDMPGIGYVVYPDGYTAKPDPEFKPSRELMSGPYENVDEFFERPTEIGRQDLELAVEGIGRLNENDPTGRFVGKIDMSNIGVFGHSLGGRIAGALAARNNAVRALISMEGIPPRKTRFEGLEMPVAMMCSSGTLPYARQNYQTLIDGRKETVYMIELQEFGHNSVTDFPYVTPGQFSYEVDPESGLNTTLRIVGAFFDAHLKDEVSFHEQTQGLTDVIITEYDRLEE